MCKDQDTLLGLYRSGKDKDGPWGLYGLDKLCGTDIMIFWPALKQEKLGILNGKESVSKGTTVHLAIWAE